MKVVFDQAQEDDEEGFITQKRSFAMDTDWRAQIHTDVYGAFLSLFFVVRKWIAVCPKTSCFT